MLFSLSVAPDVTLSHLTYTAVLCFGRGLIMKIPDLREHAIFALRNLLHNNPENQAVVNTFQVANEHVGLGPNVVVRDLPGAK
jgi:hypothetical protein